MPDDLTGQSGWTRSRRAERVTGVGHELIKGLVAEGKLDGAITIGKTGHEVVLVDLNQLRRLIGQTKEEP